MAFISNTEINSIRQTANIVDIVGSYIPLTQRGRNFICVCPFHDDHSPSMSVSEEKQIYKCFACGATGNVFTFVKEYENVSFSEAISIVANKCGMELSENSYTITTTSVFKEEYAIMELANKFYQNNLKTQVGVPALEYLHNRGIDDETIKEFGIGLSLDETNALEMLLTKKNYNLQTLEELSLVGEGKDYRYDLFTRRITFPLWDKEGRVVGFSGRVYRGEQNVSKYINSKETRIFKKGETLYNFHKAKVMMGDTGSLLLGGVISSMAIYLQIPIFLLIIAIIPILETLSDILQVFYFRRTGKRLFRMAPLHHHFELTGWRENRVVGIFSLVTFFFSLIGIMAI